MLRMVFNLPKPYLSVQRSKNGVKSRPLKIKRVFFSFYDPNTKTVILALSETQYGLPIFHWDFHPVSPIAMTLRLGMPQYNLSD